MADLKIERLTSVEAVRELAVAARTEGFAFLDRLLHDWAEGTNRFDGADEILFGAFVDGRLVATAGVTLQRVGLGRVRRVYVHPDSRGNGIAQALMKEVLEFAKGRYSELVLFTETAAAYRLYERLGFVPESPKGPDRATHRRAL